MFDHSHCQNVHSQSQNHCFKEFANFRRKIPARLLEGGRVETLFGRMPFEHAVSLHGASLIWEISGILELIKIDIVLESTSEIIEK